MLVKVATGHKMWLIVISEYDCYQGCQAAGAQSWLYDVFKVCSSLNLPNIRCHSYLNLCIHVIFIFNGEVLICFHVVSLLPAILFVIYDYLLSALIILRLLVIISLFFIFCCFLPFWRKLNETVQNVFARPSLWPIHFTQVSMKCLYFWSVKELKQG